LVCIMAIKWTPSFSRFTWQWEINVLVWWIHSNNEWATRLTRLSVSCS
jgi:hypothetical protein